MRVEKYRKAELWTKEDEEELTARVEAAYRAKKEAHDESLVKELIEKAMVVRMKKEGE